MPWNGSGEFTFNNGDYSGDDCFDQAANAGEDVTSARFTSLLEDLGVGVENLLTRDGQNSPTANLPMGGYKHTNVADADSDTEYAAWGQVHPRLIPDVVAVTANTTITSSDAGKIYRADTTSASIEFDLPDLGTDDEGFQVTIRKSNSGGDDVTITPNGSDTINGQTSHTLTEQYEGVPLLWTGTEWIIRSGSGSTLTGAAIADLLDALTGADRVSYNSLRDTPASVGSFDLWEDVTTASSAIADDDRFVIGDNSIDGDPNRYVTGATLKSYTAFDLHDDVTTVLNTSADLHNDDRILLSDESATGDPNAYTDLAVLKRWMVDAFDIHDGVTTEMTAPASADRLAISDEGTSGDPMRYITLSRLRTWLDIPFDLHDDVTTALTTLANDDRFVVSDESTSGDPNRYITAQNIRNYMLGDVNNIDTLSQTAYDALTPDSNTLYLITS